MMQKYGVDIFFGSYGRESTLYYLRDRGHDIENIYVPHNPNSRLRASLETLSRDFMLRYLNKNELSSLPPKKKQLLISIGFPYIFPKSLLDNYAYCINSHPTLLPKYRGPMSGVYQIMNGEQETGLTIHFIDQGVDTGPILLQKKICISLFDTVKSVQKRVYSLEPQAMHEALESLYSANFMPILQDETKASSYLKIRTPDDSEIDPTKTLCELYNDIRACDPVNYPAFFKVGGQRVYIKLWRKDKGDDDDDTI